MQSTKSQRIQPKIKSKAVCTAGIHGISPKGHNFAYRTLIKSLGREDGRERTRGKGQGVDISWMSWNCWGSRARASAIAGRSVKYRCKLELAHNEARFNNAFDLN